MIIQIDSLLLYFLILLLLPLSELNLTKFIALAEEQVVVADSEGVVAVDLSQGEDQLC